MGFYPGAHLVFGVLLTPHIMNEETYDTSPTHPIFDDEDRDYDLERFIAEQRGVVNPWKIIPDEINRGSGADFDKWMADHPEWERSKDEWYRIEKEISSSSPVEIQQHGHYEDPEDSPTFLVLKGHEFSADAWTSESIEITSLQFDTEEVARAYEFCEANKLPSFDDPKWYLVASYG